jgi:hypothetical protein
MAMGTEAGGIRTPAKEEVPPIMVAEEREKVGDLKTLARQ